MELHIRDVCKTFSPECVEGMFSEVHFHRST